MSPCSTAPALTRKMALKAEKKAEELGVKFVNNLKMIYVDQGPKLLGLMRRKEVFDFPTDPSACMKPWTSIYIEPDGEVRPCCYLSPVYGNLYQNDFLDLWNGEGAQELRRAMVEKDLPRSCRECYEYNCHDASIMIQV